MRTARWNAKRLGVAAAGLLVLYALFSASRQTHDAEVLVRNTPPKVVWDFVADFSNMLQLNPTIQSFAVIEDGGNTHHWRYGVEYTERLSHWPYWLNKSTAFVSVKHIVKDRKSPEEFVVESVHQTCFLGGFYCLNSVGIFTFHASGPHTLCHESITYQCPPFMRSFCRTEVEFQRNAIMKNLAAHFA